jgi:hypothetical protein
MDVPLFDVYLTGKLAAALDREQAAARLAQIFKAAPATMLGLLTGKPQLLKRGVDKNTALKYREALQNAGVEVAFKAQTQNPAAQSPAPVQSAPVQSDPVRNASAATQTAAPASIPPTTSATATSATPNPTQTSTATSTVSSAIGSGLTLAPAGTNVLTADEQSHVIAPAIDLSHLAVAAPGPLLEDAERVLHRTSIIFRSARPIPIC